MNETNKTFRNLLGFLLLTALFALLTATVRVENAASGWEYPPERELIPLEMIGRVEMLPSQPVEGAPPQAPPENGTPPQFPPGPPNFGASSTAFGPVPVDGKTWGILIIESVILALGIAFASLYKKERP